MTVLTDLARLLSGKATASGKKLAYGQVDDVVGWRAYDDARASGMSVAKPGEAYFRWYVQELWQRVETKWLSEYQPLVYSSTRLRFGSADIEIPVTLGELKAGFSAQVVGSGNSLMLNLPITPALPYDGSTSSWRSRWSALRRATASTI
jgi:hypothetical protein